VYQRALYGALVITTFLCFVVLGARWVVSGFPGRLLMNRFLRRLSAERISVFSAHLIGRAGPAQSAVASDPRYAGVVVFLPGIQSGAL